MEKKTTLAILGGLIGVGAIILAIFGNPANMSICIACFIRDIAGGLKLQTAAPVQYIRPEILGIILGATITALIRKDFKATAGSSPAVRFILGFIMMVGALIFLGCSFRMIIRMGAGDLNAWVGLIGFLGGVATGTFFLKKGYSLGKSQETKIQSGFIVPIVTLIILGLSLATTIFAVSKMGPGSVHAPVLISLAVGLGIGVIGQLTRLCSTGAFRNVMLAKDFNLLIVFGSFFGVFLIYNIVTGNFNPSFVGQPIAHTNTLFNILGLYIFGFTGILAGGCPFRQLILTGQGSSDGAMTLLGLLLGAAFAHNFGLAAIVSTPDVVGGPTDKGVIVVVISIIALFVIAITNREKTKEKK
ncbi:MAG: YedE family putative selenium transporter [Firmicutes bacterium]|nr:YedE family putative selenium transporter [Bacillota bacterium]